MSVQCFFIFAPPRIYNDIVTNVDEKNKTVKNMKYESASSCLLVYRQINLSSLHYFDHDCYMIIYPLLLKPIQNKTLFIHNSITGSVSRMTQIHANPCYCTAILILAFALFILLLLLLNYRCMLITPSIILTPAASLQPANILFHVCVFHLLQSLCFHRFT